MIAEGGSGGREVEAETGESSKMTHFHCKRVRVRVYYYYYIIYVTHILFYYLILHVEKYYTVRLSPGNDVSAPRNKKKK